VERALSPPLPDVHRSKSPNFGSPRTTPPIPTLSSVGNLPSSNHLGGSAGTGSTGFGNNDLEGGGGGGGGGGRSNLGAFDTSLPLRVDYEAMLAYLLLPPAGGVFLLLVEHKSDYVRFHAWQSSMLFSTIFIIHLLFAWSSFISWLMFVGDIALIAFLSLHAYRDVDSLEHYEVPFFGRLANSFVDNE